MGNKRREATFLAHLGPDGIEIYDILLLLEAEKNDMDEILKTIQVKPMKHMKDANSTYETKSQDSYLSAVRTLAKTWNFGRKSQFRNRIVIGISDNSTKKKLLQNSKLIL